MLEMIFHVEDLLVGDDSLDKVFDIASTIRYSAVYKVFKTVIGLRSAYTVLHLR